MSKIAVNEITDEQGSGRPAFTNGVQTSNINGGQVGGRRNLIINGAMQVAQRGTSVNGVTSDGYHTVDRWVFNFAAGSLDIEQSSDAPENFSNSLRATVGSTYSPGSTNQNYIGTRLESQNVRHLGYGTSSPRASVLSFWIKSNDTGARAIWLYNTNANQARHYAQLFSVSQVNTWEKFEFIIPPDTFSFNNDNNTGLDIRIMLASGYQGGIPDTGWEDLSLNRHAGADNFFDTIGNEFYLTGVQLEVGDTATEFEHRSIGEELALCQRYYTEYNGDGSLSNYYDYFMPLTIFSGDRCRGTIQLPVEMRVAPTVEVEGSLRVVGKDNFSGGGGDASTINLSSDTRSINAGGSLPDSYNNSFMYLYISGDIVKADAEL